MFILIQNPSFHWKISRKRKRELVVIWGNTLVDACPLPVHKYNTLFWGLWWGKKGSSYLHNSHGMTKKKELGQIQFPIKIYWPPMLTIGHVLPLMTLKKISSCSRKCLFQLTEEERPINCYYTWKWNPNWLKFCRPFGECIWHEKSQVGFKSIVSRQFHQPQVKVKISSCLIKSHYK